MKKVAVISLGCDKNRVDTENMLYYLSGRYALTQKIEEAEVIIVNTCAFIESAREEAVDTILECAALKPEKLVVTGCLPEKYERELYRELPEVDAFLGIRSYDKIADVLDSLYAHSGQRIDRVSCGDRFEGGAERIITTPYHYAYLKIADGCGNFCTYCTIPSIRGKYRSRELETLVREAEMLASGGVRELILVAQDVTKYGSDRGENALIPLLRRLSQIQGIEWIRLLYCYPESVGEELIGEIAQNPKVVKYIDIPLQHVDDGILKRMGRNTNEKAVKGLIDKLRKSVPGLAIRSTFIAGFPGEGEREFSRLCDFLKEYKIDNAGFFAYSKEEGTPAAKLKEQVSEPEKRRRVETLYTIQRQVQRENSDKKQGQVYRVLADGADFERGVFYGRAYFQAPDIDTVILLKSGRSIDAGSFYDVTITGNKDYDLIGEIK